MDPKAFFQERMAENPLTKKEYNGVNKGWGEHLVNPPPAPPIPANWPRNAKWVWNSKGDKYVKGLKQFNYVPNIKTWLNRQAAKRARESQTRRARSHSRSHSRRRSHSRSNSRR